MRENNEKRKKSHKTCFLCGTHITLPLMMLISNLRFETMKLFKIANFLKVAVSEQIVTIITMITSC